MLVVNSEKKLLVETNHRAGLLILHPGVMDGTDHRFVLLCVRDRIAGGAEHSKATVSGTAPEPHTATPCKWVLRGSDFRHRPGFRESEKCVHVPG